MRRSFSNVGVSYTPNKLFYGLSFGNDACAEHEIGIKKLAKNLGVSYDSDNSPGIDCRVITKPENVLLLKSDTMVMLTTKRTRYTYATDKTMATFDDYKTWEFKNLTLEELKDNYVCAWDENHFQMIGSLKHFENLFETMKQCIDNKDVCIVSYKQPFSGISYQLFICHRLNVEIKNAIYNADMLGIHLKELLKEHGFDVLLKTKASFKNHHYFGCCSPHLLCSNIKNPNVVKEACEKAHTKYNLNFWVNYSDADDHYGWHTGEQIKEWLESDTKTLKQINEDFKKKYKNQ